MIQLQEAWVDWIKLYSYQGQRFGQYVYNLYKYELNNSYNIDNGTSAYQMLFESITQSLDEVMEGKEE